MDPFDPAMHYGPNDAGISALSIGLVIIGLIFGSWLIGTTYTFISGYIERLFQKKE
tara:strand:+ start:272 stop:439 length:168 start_codon:yes stop_codon:yes gene_type:complete